ncbi:TSUP family transporter [Nitratidesulfovibrio sp. D1]|uniref:TSUP family transporter n=1 Tax=Nitratidesulfovibrio sp. D1 TaxID=3440151 RepID=UPI003EB75145
MPYRTNILYPAFGNFFIAALTGIIGVGGGFLFTPMLHAAFGLPMMVAVGTGNFVKVANIGSQFIVRGVADTVIYQLAVFAMLGGYCGANFGRRLGCDVGTRLAKLLVYMAYEVLGDEAAWHEPAVIPVRLTQEQMAAMTGSCQQTVSDFLREMQDEGLVRVTRREVVVLHPLRLLERAEL